MVCAREAMFPSCALPTASDCLLTAGRRPSTVMLVDHQLPATGYDTWILPLDGVSEAYPFVQTPYSDSGGTFSPDGRWLSYHSDEPGRFEVYVTPFPGPGRKWQISSGGGAWSRWRGDGKEIYYQGLNGQLMAVSVDVRDGSFVVGEAEPLFDVSKLGHFYIFDATKDGQRFLVVRPEQAVESLPLTLIVNWTAGLKEN